MTAISPKPNEPLPRGYQYFWDGRQWVILKNGTQFGNHISAPVNANVINQVVNVYSRDEKGEQK